MNVALDIDKEATNVLQVRLTFLENIKREMKYVWVKLFF